MENIAEILKNTPRGTKLYSPICGECELKEVTPNYIIVYFKKEDTILFHFFNHFGQEYEDGECLLFPSKEERDWEGHQILAPHYDFKPFDKIVGRDNKTVWVADMFSHYTSIDAYPYSGLRGIPYDECLPYNEETAKLIGTTKDYVDDKNPIFQYL